MQTKESKTQAEHIQTTPRITKQKTQTETQT